MTSTPNLGSPLLPSISSNESSTTTIVLLHGLCSSPQEWTHVQPYLTNPQPHDSTTYHILTPYLPGHGEASSLTPFSLPHATELIAQLISTKAHHGKAHVVGLSAGGYVGLHLAKTYPSLVSSLLVTGVGDTITRNWLLRIAPYVLYPTVYLQASLPESAWNWVQRKMGLDVPADLRQEMWTNSKLSLLQDAYRSIRVDGTPAPLETRTLIVAGGKQDSVPGTKVYGEEARKGNGASRAVVVREALHAWNLQFPKLFAEGIRAWIEDRELPHEFESLV